MVIGVGVVEAAPLALVLTDSRPYPQHSLTVGPLISSAEASIQ
jgi:hypothetical protein